MNRRLKEIWKETIKKHIEKWKLRPLPETRKICRILNNNKHQGYQC